MKELFEKATVINEVKVEQKKEIKYLGEIRAVRGHTLFEFNTKTRSINKATIVKGKSALKNSGGKYIEVPGRSSVFQKSDCVYLWALNSKNALKKISKLF